ncbi:uncharacterized protein LOC120184155 [Hibiscus syriacus]|uniref:uncharacterized protein LOC120184155 n=1 Tax=Hibiscus syriacus TaxID=106335 RepID=UPI001921370F|nr:uncharacterized protein LOC120184155 [Hibiscus syriacus]
MFDTSKALKIRRSKVIRLPKSTALSDWIQVAQDKAGLGSQPVISLPGVPPNVLGETSNSVKDSSKGLPNAPRAIDGSPSFKRYFKEHCQHVRPKITALSETRISNHIADKVVSRLGFSNYTRAKGFSGGIELLWNDQVNLVSISNHFIHCRYNLEDDSRWYFLTAVYASPEVIMRKHLWGRLSELNPKSDSPLILGGDFNSIVRSEERKGGMGLGSGIDKLFCEFIFDMGLLEADYRGLDFTWRLGSLYKQLDRCLMNTCWANIFSASFVLHLDKIGFDHCPKIQEWNSNMFGHIEKRKNKLLTRIKGIDRALIFSYSDSLVDLQERLKEELDITLQQEESLWFRKARTKWVLYGDKNNKYFHTSNNAKTENESGDCG